MGHVSPSPVQRTCESRQIAESNQVWHIGYFLIDTDIQYFLLQLISDISNYSFAIPSSGLVPARPGMVIPWVQKVGLLPALVSNLLHKIGNQLYTEVFMIRLLFC